MVCSACGTPVVAGVNFCARCGAAVVGDPQQAANGAPPPPIAAHYGVPYVPPARVQRHLQTLGILWCVFAAYRVIAGVVGMVMVKAFTLGAFGGWGFPFGRGFRGGPGWMAGLLPVIAAVTVVFAGLAAFAGWSLLNRKPWGRVLAIVVGVLALVKFPLGTALGIYTLWVLAPGDSGAEWEGIAEGE